VICPANEGQIEGEFYSQSKESSIRPMKARETRNFIFDPKSHQSSDCPNEEYYFRSKESSVRPIKAREIENIIFDPKSH
jgi:hypothetical protein